MKLLLKSVSQKFRRHLQRPVRFSTACGYSLGLHVLLFVLAGCLVGLFDMRGPDFPALVFELILAPARVQVESDEFTSANRKQQVAGIAPSLTQKQNHSPHEVSPAAKRAPSPDLSEFDPVSALDLEEPSASIHDEDAGNEVAPAQPAMPRLNAVSLQPISNFKTAAPELVPFKMPVPSSQRKIILKKVKKMISKSLASAAYDSIVAWEKDGQNFQLQLRHLPAPSATGLDELLVTVTTLEGGDTLSTHLRMRRLAFSQFAQFVDYWDPHVALHDDELDGRFHSNSALVISSSGGTQPKFNGKVTTAGYSIRNAAAPFFIDYKKIFPDGLEEGADPIPLPRVFLGIPQEDTTHVRSFEEETWLTFHRDGSYTWRSVSAPQTEHRAVLKEAPGCIIGMNKLHVKGVVKGLWLVYSDKKIIIDDDVLYAHNPEVLPTSGDFLGLVSTKDIEIAPPAVTGPGDLKIYAAILTKGQFRVSHIYARNTGTLHIYGSLSAGSISATEPRYATRVHFDNRFDKMRPPNFPMTNRYEITEWDARWKVK